MYKIIDKFIRLWRKPPPKPVVTRRIVDTDSIRARLKALSWTILEIPIKRNHPDPAERKVVRWKLVATKGEKSMEVTGPNIDEAFKQLGMTLGVIAR